MRMRCASRRCGTPAERDGTIALIAPERVRTWAVPAVALLLGASLGPVFDYSGQGRWNFPAGAVRCGCWLMATPFALSRAFEAPWLAPATRIFGSWLVAIGLMLCAAVAGRL